jgi:hypothetical protein
MPRSDTLHKPVRDVQAFASIFDIKRRDEGNSYSAEIYSVKRTFFVAGWSGDYRQNTIALVEKEKGQ